MSQKKIAEFITWAKDQGWEVAENLSHLVSLPETISSRYHVPKEYLAFLAAVGLCASSMGTEWFLCEENYREDDDAMFHWDEYERLSLAAAQDLGDEYLEKKIRDFWDGVLPFFITVGNGYEYYGYDLGGHKGPKGAIIHGWEPEFEEAEPFAPNLDGFLELLINGKVPLGGVLFDPDEYEFMEMAGRAEQERQQRQSAQALEALLHPEKAAHDPEEANGDCGCGHHHGHPGEHHHEL